MTWLFSSALLQECAKSPSLPEPVAESLADICLDGKPFAQLNVMPTPHQFWRNDKTMDFSGHSRFGLTCAALTESLGMAVLTFFREVFLARTSAWLDRGGGIDGSRSGLWSQMERIAGEVRPVFVYVENSPALTSRGLGRVLGDLAALGYDTEWLCLSAGECGAPHKRDRIWILAYSDEIRRSRRTGDQRQGWRPEFADGSGRVANANGMRELQPQGGIDIIRGRSSYGGLQVADTDGDIAQGLEPESQPPGQRRPSRLLGGTPAFHGWPADPAETPESGLDRMAYGLADWLDGHCPRVTDISKHRSDRIKAIGNGQVPRVAAAAFSILAARFGLGVIHA